jgi:hypothetical protein
MRNDVPERSSSHELTLGHVKFHLWAVEDEVHWSDGRELVSFANAYFSKGPISNTVLPADSTGQLAVGRNWEVNFWLAAHNCKMHRRIGWG